MKFRTSLLFMALALSGLSFLTSCDENSTIDVPGPDVNYTFVYTGEEALRSTITQVWIPIAFDTVPGRDLVAYLKNDSVNKKYADAIQTATIKNGVMTVAGDGLNFQGIDSLKLSYRFIGTEQEYDLVTGKPNAELTSINFGSIKTSKAEVLDMMSKDKVVVLYGAFNPAQVNCFVPGAVFSFKAKCMLGVKTSSLLN